PAHRREPLLQSGGGEGGRPGHLEHELRHLRRQPAVSRPVMQRSRGEDAAAPNPRPRIYEPGTVRKNGASHFGCMGKLDAPDELLPAVRALGARHLDYGVEPQDYDTVGSALLWTLEKGLGAAFTDPVKEAWAAVYHVLATTMQETTMQETPPPET